MPQKRQVLLSGYLKGPIQIDGTIFVFAKYAKEGVLYEETNNKDLKPRCILAGDHGFIIKKIGF